MRMNFYIATRTAALLLVITSPTPAGATPRQQPPVPPAAQQPPVAPAVQPPASTTSAAAVSEWRDKLTAAKTLTDETARRDALLALMREALKDRDVQPSGTKSAGQVHPDDNRPVPVVNFDVNLQNKTAYSANPEASTRSLATNFGYYFTVKGVAYVVLGPAALDPRGPVFTRLSSGHELFHAEHHVGDPRPIEDRELETWTAMFVKYFHDVHTFRQKWGPLVTYYEQANPVEQKIALDKLVAYYRSPPSSIESKSDSAAVAAAFKDWLARRKKDAETSASKLVRDLETAIAATVAGGEGDN